MKSSKIYQRISNRRENRSKKKTEFSNKLSQMRKRSEMLNWTNKLNKKLPKTTFQLKIQKWSQSQKLSHNSRKIKMNQSHHLKSKKRNTLILQLTKKKLKAHHNQILILWLLQHGAKIHLISMKIPIIKVFNWKFQLILRCKIKNLGQPQAHLKIVHA